MNGLPLIHSFSVLDNLYVFDANSNCILSLDEEQWHIIREIEKGNITEEGQVLIDKFRERNYFLAPDIRKIEHPDTETLQYHLNRKMQKLTLQVTQDCNLRCDYCVYSETGAYKTRAHARKSMDFETAKKAVDYVLKSSIDQDDVNFAFYGGEPLLEIDLVEKIIVYIKEKCGAKSVTFNMTTNGTLLTPEVYERLAKSDVTILISLDGPKAIHDSARKYPDGRGSFDDIVKNISAIRAKYPDANDRLSFLAVTTPEIDDSCLGELYRMDEIFPYYGVILTYLSDTYIEREIKFSEEFTAMNIQERTKLFLHMLGKLDKSKVSSILLSDMERIRMKYKELQRIAELPTILHHGGPCLAGPQRLFLSVEGIFYPCERVSETSDVMKIGDVDNGVNVEKANIVNNVGKITEEECKKCWAILHCLTCAAHADDLVGFSKEKKLKKCDGVKAQVEDMFKDVCFLKTHGYDFEDA